MTDNDLAFTSEVVTELCDLFGVKKVWTSAYHPQCNGSIKRQHQTVIRMVGKLSHNQKANWPKHLPEVIQAYNETCSTITGFSPHNLLFGYQPRFPVDLMFPTIGERCIIRIDIYVAMLQQCLAEALDEACHPNVFKAHHQKRYYN